jgi:hypothetical protein
VRSCEPKGQHTHIPREGLSPLPSAATSNASTRAARGLDMISRRDHAQRPRGTRAKSLRRPEVRAHTRAAPAQQRTTAAECESRRERPPLRLAPHPPPPHDRPTPARKKHRLRSSERGTAAGCHYTTSRRHTARAPNRRAHRCRGASGRASSDGSGGEGRATAARLMAAQRQPSQLGRQ